jgi:hypothetical protein
VDGCFLPRLIERRSYILPASLAMAPSAVEGGVRGDKRIPTRADFDFSYPFQYITARGELQLTVQGLEPSQQEVLLVESDGSSASSSSSSWVLKQI